MNEFSERLIDQNPEVGADNIYFQFKEYRLENLLSAAKISTISGWNVLDLGCGSKDSTSVDFGDDRRFEAWFPRVCAANGAARVVGVDLYDQSPEDKNVYEHIRADLKPLLTGEVLVKKFGKQSFNLINTEGFLLHKEPGAAFSGAMGFSEMIMASRGTEEQRQKVDRLIENLLKQSMKLLKPGGIASIEENAYQLQDDGTLKPLKVHFL